MSVLPTVKKLIRSVPSVDNALCWLGGRRLDKDYSKNVFYYQSGSVDPEAHMKRLRKTWQPRRYLHNASEARVALICMETWESRSLIPGIANSFDTVHIPIRDTSDHAFYTAQQQDVVRKFIDADTHSPFDMVLVYATNAQISADTLNTIRGYGPLVAVMCLDDKQSFRDLKPQRSWPGGQFPLIGSAHVHLTNARECVRWYDRHNASALHWPEGAHVDFGFYAGAVQDIDVSFVGQCYGIRRNFVDKLRRQGINVSCFGRGWENSFVSDSDMFRVFARSKINLGLGYVGYSTSMTCLKGRDFDVPGTGNFYLTTYDTELADCFRVGEEIVCYRNGAECAELIRYYLERPEARKQIADAGRGRVVREHTWQYRLEYLMQWAGIAEKKKTVRALPIGNGASIDDAASDS
ncbi:MAG: glycosyltransferase [Pseudomonadota bacterium]